MGSDVKPFGGPILIGFIDWTNRVEVFMGSGELKFPGGGTIAVDSWITVWILLTNCSLFALNASSPPRA